jgi:hypothetical protein
MEEVKQILHHYNLGDQRVLNYESHSHDPDMWSHTFEAKNKKYILVEVEAVDDNLRDEEYERLETDLHIRRANLKLITPKLEQMHTMNNRAGIGIDGYGEIISADDAKDLHEAQEVAAKQYFPPTPEELLNPELKKYRNPHDLHSETTWILFELLQ